MVANLKLAITGGTGFVGSHLLTRALAAGHRVRALTRRPQEPREGVDWINGALDRPDSLAELCDGTDAVIHVAGVINAPDSAGFEVGNVAGTAAILTAATGSDVKRFVHVSSLAAREPGLSLYGASKARSELKVACSGLAYAIVRPPAVYGPGDRETLELFKMAKRGLVLLPPIGGKLSLIHADDLAELLLALSEQGGPAGVTIEPDDGHPGGWDYKEFALMLANAFGKARVVTLHPQPWFINLAARADQLLRGRQAKLTADRAAYFCHPDWVASPDRAAPETLWKPQVPTEQGLADTARWYRDAGWL